MAPLQTEALKIEPPADTQSSNEASIVAGILALGQEARQVLQATMQAFATQDAAAARSIWQEDDVVDVRYHLVRHDLMTILAGMHAIPALPTTCAMR